MAIQKKHGKGRLDKWYRLAKEKGYRARAAFKLIQLNRKYGFLEKSKVLLDLCAAPGSWCQVAAETMPTGSLIIGVDLAPIKPIPRTITFQSDITTDKCRATIRSHLKTWKADTVLHDGAPNVGIAWVQDAYSQADLVLESLKLAVEFLTAGGNFVTKLFRSKDYNALIWIFNQLFEKVEATKPPSSRNVSAEIFVVCRGFKAPKRIDPRLLDGKSVFAELAAPKENHEAKVYNPEKKTRKREGYEEGDWTQFKELPASSFVTAADPIELLSTINRFHFGDAGSETENVTQEVLKKLDETTDEIRACAQDLKVLSRRDFKLLLRWRIRAREILGITKSKDTTDQQEEQAEVVPLDEELQMQQDLQSMERATTSRKKKERRRENERKRKEIIRLQMHMQTPTDIGIESGGAPIGENGESVFSLKTADTANAVGHLSKGHMPALTIREKSPTPEIELSSDEEGDRLEAELDELYEHYQQEKADANNKYRAKRARKAHEKDEWDGFGSDEEKGADDGAEGSESNSDSDSEDDGEYKTFHTQGIAMDGDNPLSRDAQMFFSQDLFKDIAGLETNEDKDSGIDMDDSSPSLSDPKSVESTSGNAKKKKANDPPQTAKEPVLEMDIDSESGETDSSEDEDDASSDEIEVQDEEDVFGNEIAKKDDGPQDIEIITAEAMELARQLASGQKKQSDLMDDGFNKFAFRDRDGLPAWFLDDENQHSKPLRPISASAAAAIKEKMRLLNARPIKKVQEARARKKNRMARRLEKLRKKSALLADDEGMSEKDKAASIQKMMNRAVKKQPQRKTQVVVARGVNRGISGRPRGVKGRYKVVDARLKKDARALKRLEKKKKK